LFIIQGLFQSRGWARCTASQEFRIASTRRLKKGTKGREINGGYRNEQAGRQLITPRSRKVSGGKSDPRENACAAYSQREKENR